MRLMWPPVKMSLTALVKSLFVVLPLSKRDAPALHCLVLLTYCFIHSKMLNKSPMGKEEEANGRSFAVVMTIASPFLRKLRTANFTPSFGPFCLNIVYPATETLILSLHPSIRETFDHLLWARHHARSWKYNEEFHPKL